jgi:glycosyltransferase involved in cell wall biosynthesis
MKLPHKQVAAIIPCRNEAGSIAALVEQLRGIGVARIIVAMDPKCTDRTAAAASSVGAEVVLSAVSGYDGPVLTGIAALHEFTGWILFLDAGDKYKVSTIGDLIQQSDPAATMTFGIRDHQLFWHQRFGNNVFKAVLWARFRGHWAKDVSSVRLIRTDVVPLLQLEDRQFSLPFQTLVHGLKQEFRIDYIPIECTKNRVGVSKVSGSPRNSAKAAIQMLLSVWKAPEFQAKEKSDGK